MRAQIAAASVTCTSTRPHGSALRYWISPTSICASRTPRSTIASAHDARSRSPRPDELPADEQEPDPEHRRRADVDVDRVADPEPEALDVLVGSRVRAGRRRDRAGDDHHRARGDARRRRASAEPAGRRRGAPRPLAWLHASNATITDERDDHEREQEVGHHGERMEVEDDRDAAERDLRDRPEEGRERGPAHPSREGPRRAATRARSRA